MQHLLVRLAQTPGVDPSSWAAYGPLGLIVVVLVAANWYYLRREASRADRYEALLIRMIEANQIASRSVETSHEALIVGQERIEKEAILEALVQRIIEQESKK